MRKTIAAAALATSCSLLSLPAFSADNGIYLGGTNTLDSDIVITTGQAPVPIPLKSHTIVTISSL